MNTHLLRLSAACAVLAASTTAQVALRHLATVDLDSTANPANPEFIGSNPAAIAWNGTDLYVAGFNSAGTTANVGIVAVTGALTTPAFGTPFGVLATPNLRGYSGLDVRGTTLAAAYDDGGTNANGITAWDLAGTSLWVKSARGGSGVGFDPGFAGGNPAQGAGVGWTQFGSGRRALQDAATGADIWTTANGMVILTSEGTFWRDMDYDDATGDIWLREGNNVIHGVRSGDNAVSSVTVPFDPADADFVNTQNLAFVRAGGTAAVFFNDRSSTAGGQAFFDVVEVIAPDGSPRVVDWGGFTAPTGVGGYDFSYDPASGTLAILDFSNRDVHVFEVAETCATLTVAGSGASGTQLDFALDGAAPNAPALLVFSGLRGSTSISLGAQGTLDLGLAQPFIIESIGNTDVNGDASLPLVVPPGITPRAVLGVQGFTLTVDPVTGVFDFCTSGVADFGVGQ